MSLVYGGHNKIIEAQLVVLTTHQLYRYPSYFDLLILDEADAFPYYHNELLNVFLNKACKGPIVYLSATIKKDFLDVCQNVVYVNRRFHNVDLPVPEYIKYNKHVFVGAPVLATVNVDMNIVQSLIATSIGCSRNISIMN